MEKDKIQCDAWKDEVQNLLIFAGLFSAVVTAFIIESYKALKPDPNDAIISLLSVIANRLDNKTESTMLLPSSTGPRSSFSPSTSSIRVNIFWFISLVLSLATVLIGIISLQWIREHQNYPKLSPKETFALFNMRSDGLERWHVPKIFTALPLLLQSALVLFLSGIVDFLSAFSTVVVIPVGTVTVLVLLFLVATTVLPTLQGPLLYLPYPYVRTSKIPPAQCPYKSPQAHAFRGLLRSIIRLSTNFFPGQRSWHQFSVHMWITWRKKTWADFDMAWLRLRDAFARRSYNRLSTKHYYYEDCPVFDLTQGLMASVQSRDIDLIQDSLPAQYHCFNEISEWKTAETPEFLTRRNDEYFLHARGYLRDLISMISGHVALSDFFYPDTHSGSPLGAHRDHEEALAEILHQENAFLFLWFLGKYRGIEDLFAHKLELTIRLSTIAYMEEYELYATAPNSAWHNFQAEYTLFPLYLEHGRDTDLFFWQWVNKFFLLFQGAARIQPPYNSGRTLYTHPLVFDYVAVSTRFDLHKVFQSTEGLGPAIQRKFSDIFQFITDNLNEQMSSPYFPPREPHLLFYITALYLHAARRPFHHSLDNLLSAMRIYKQRTIDAGIVSNILEELYGRNPAPYFIRFSSSWWEFLKEPSTHGSSTSSKSHVSTQEK